MKKKIKKVRTSDLYVWIQNSNGVKIEGMVRKNSGCDPLNCIS